MNHIKLAIATITGLLALTATASIAVAAEPTKTIATPTQQNPLIWSLINGLGSCELGGEWLLVL